VPGGTRRRVTDVSAPSLPDPAARSSKVGTIVQGKKKRKGVPREGKGPKKKRLLSRSPGAFFHLKTH
jgi:hypothetical protein